MAAHLLDAVESLRSIAASFESVLTRELGSSPSIDEAMLPDLLAAIEETEESAERHVQTDDSSKASSTEPASTAEPDPDAAKRSERPDSISPATDETGEFVVRVFNERGSIGTVGHSTSAGALTEAAAYFFERGLSGIRLPWGPDDGPIVVHDEPVDDDGTVWDAYERLPNDLYVKTAGSVDDRRTRVEALASRAGLRIMLSGDWSN